MGLFERAPAKINLSLDVLGKREDGFHEVEMIMTSVDLADHVELQELHRDVIEVSADSRYVPDDERNLAYKAAAAFKHHYQLTRGVRIDIKKNIPVAAGLEVAAVMRLLFCAALMKCGLSVLHRLSWLNWGQALALMCPFVFTARLPLEQGMGKRFVYCPHRLAAMSCWPSRILEYPRGIFSPG